MATQNNIASIGNKYICAGLGCSSEATNSVEEEVGDKMIVLDLCDDCLIKFREY